MADGQTEGTGTGGRPRASYRDRVLAKIQRYTAADRDETVAFRRSVYGPDAFAAQPDYLRWLHESPNAAGEPSPMWLFRSEGAIEGQQAGIRARLRIDGREVDAMWATHLVVSPAFLLRGVGAVLSELVTAETPVTLGVEVTESAKKAFLRAGWTDLGEVPMYMRPIDVGTVLAARGRTVPRPVAMVLNGALAVIDAAIGLVLRAMRLRLVEVDRFDERSDRVWAAAAQHYPVIVRRDAATLNWRFADFPRSGFYRAFYLQRGDTTLGYAVLRTGNHGGVRSGHIVDFLCSPGWTSDLLAACVRLLRRDGVKAVYCMQASGRLRKHFAVAGFLRRSTGWPHLVLTRDLTDVQRAQVLEPTNWFLTSGDSNVDYPREGTVYAT